MTAEDFSQRLEAVRKSGRGFISRCPAHEDRTPSLSIRDGERGVLLHCFSGCEKAAIVRALGLRMKDLFCESISDSRQTAQVAQLRERQRRERERRREAENVTLDACKHAHWFINSRRGLDISRWSDEQLNDELNALADAYALLESEGL